MSLMITDDCIACAACVDVCPNHGIRKDDKTRSIYVIDTDACSECVGFFHQQQCVVVCPMNCCLPDPRSVQTEAVLFERAQAIHADRRLTLTVETSHFQTPVAEKWWKRLFGSVGKAVPSEAVNDFKTRTVDLVE